MTATLDNPLGADRIRAALPLAANSRLDYLTVLPETDSTNAAIGRLPSELQHAHAILAEQQTRGRGRRERSWYSPAGGNIYLSLGWRFGSSEVPLGTLPLAVAVCICLALGQTGLEGHAIKWPNDIQLEGKKLAGVLVELQSSGNGPALAIIGVGVNINMPGQGAAESRIDRPWTDLASEIAESGSLDRNCIAALLLNELLAGLDRFENSGFESFAPAWQGLDTLNGRKVRLEHAGEFITGTARGIDELGGLLLETDVGEVKAYHSGEASVHHA